MPIEAATLEDRFWAKVWRCMHRWPCKKCCWPWIGIKGIARYDDPRECWLGWTHAGSFFPQDLARS
jgi:hypothetical protein